MGADPDEVAALLQHVRPLTEQAADREADAERLRRARQLRPRRERAGASALSLINTLRGMALDPRSGSPWLGGTTGGVSGPAVRAIALAQVHAVSQATTIPLIGMGGVQSGRDALDLIRAGADLVAVGTESFRDPAAGSRIAAELDDTAAND